MRSWLVVLVLACTVASVLGRKWPPGKNEDKKDVKKCFHNNKWNEITAKIKNPYGPLKKACEKKKEKGDGLRKCCENLLRDTVNECKEDLGDNERAAKRCACKKLKIICFEQGKEELLKRTLNDRKVEVEEAVASCESKENYVDCFKESLREICNELKHRGGK